MPFNPRNFQSPRGNGKLVRIRRDANKSLVRDGITWEPPMDVTAGSYGVIVGSDPAGATHCIAMESGATWFYLEEWFDLVIPRPSKRLRDALRFLGSTHRKKFAGPTRTIKIIAKR